MVEQIFRTVKYCEKCDAEYDENDDFCQKDGTKLVQYSQTRKGKSKKANIDRPDLINQSPETNNISHKIVSQDFISRLTRGDFGLAKTFWLYGFLVSFMLNIMFKIVEYSSLVEDDWLFIIGIGIVSWAVVAWTGIWRSASRHEGSPVWAVLAKSSVILGVLISLAQMTAR